jgi:hypothetical protein
VGTRIQIIRGRKQEKNGRIENLTVLLMRINCTYFIFFSSKGLKDVFIYQGLTDPSTWITLGTIGVKNKKKKNKGLF